MNRKFCFFVMFISTLMLDFKIQAHPQQLLLDEQDITYENVRSIFQSNEEKINTLQALSKDRDIVAFIGATGSGKSTLVNYLSEKPLIVDETGNIVLMDSLDQTAMKIGTGAQSETFLPQSLAYKDLLFCDFPGFSDTRGTATNFVNACCIKSLLEKASMVRLVFVVGQDEMTAERGKLFKNFLNITRQLIPHDQNKNVESFSSLVVTKSRVGFDNKQLIERLRKSTEPDVLEPWIEAQRLTHMSDTLNGEINQNDRAEIIEVIRNTPNQKINNVSIGATFDDQEKAKIKSVYIKELNDISNQVIANKLDVNDHNYLNLLDKDALRSKQEYFENNFFEALKLSVHNSEFITLLRSVSESIYTSCWSETEISKQLEIKNILEQIKTRLAKIAEEEALEEALEKARIEQQKRIQAEEEAKRLEEEAKRNDPAHWPLVVEQKTETFSKYGLDYYGDWEKYKSGGGVFARYKNRRQLYQKEILVTVVTERTVAKDPSLGQTIVRQDWHEVSKTETLTGKIQAMGKFMY